MNLEELKTKFIAYLEQKGKLDDNKIAELSSPTSVFFLGVDFLNFVKENFSALGIKSKDKIPQSISEILKMADEEQEEYDVPKEEQKQGNNQNIISFETTYGKEDSSVNLIKNNIDKSGKINTQEVNVYDANGALKSNYVTEYDGSGNVRGESQIEYGDNTGTDLAIGYSEQGEKGDCWLLSTLNSLSYSDAGKEIIKNAVSKNEDGSYSIAFKGVNTCIRISQEELDAAKASGNYAKGDDDVTLFELGFESVISKIQKGEIQIPGNHSGLSIKQGDTNSPLAGGNLEDAIFLLTGKDVKSEFKAGGASTEEFDKILSSLKDNPDKYAAIIGFSAGDTPFVLRDVNGNDICTLEAGTNHAFSIKSVDEDGVTIVNPWDSSKEYKISLADARKFSTGIQYYALDESFQETNTLDANKLDQEPNQSSGGVPGSGTDGLDANQPASPTDTPVGGTNPITENNPNTNPSSGGTGGGTYTPTTSTDNSNNGPKGIKDMSLDELKTQKNTTEGELKTNQDKYNAIMDGTDETVAGLKTAKEEAYTKFQDELKKQDAQLSQEYDDAKKAVDDKQKEIDENDKKITETETNLSAAKTKLSNAESKVTSLENCISALKSELSSAKDGDKSSIQSKIAAAEAALTAAKNERDAAKAEKEKIENDLNTLNDTKTKLEGELTPLKDKVTEIEAKIASLTENSPELKTEYDAYKAAEKAYDDGKTEAAKSAKEAINAKQTELNEINTQMGVLENRQNEREYSTSKLKETYTLNGKEYMSLMSQSELDNFLANEWKNGNYNYNSNCLSMAQLYCKDIMNNMGLRANYQDYINDDQSSVEQKAKESLDNGYPVVLHVSTKAGTRHFATAVGYRIGDDGKISFLLADNVTGVGITACGEGEYRHLITGYSTPYKNQNYGYRCMIYG